MGTPSTMAFAVNSAGEWLAGFPFPLTVEGGPELRAAVADVADRMGRALEDR